MEMRLSTSGALSRSHYALVQRVEHATSPQEIDLVVLREVTDIRNRLSKTGLTSAQRMECLVVLMYCSMTLSFPPPNTFEFSLSHAVQLAESGQSLRDRRIAYQYCIQNIPAGHELNLMLVNTVRKDIESREEPRLALALDYLLQKPSPDVIPAVQARLISLLSHKSVDIKRRTLLALRALSTIGPSLLDPILPKLKKRATHPNLGVALGALDILSDHAKEHNSPFSRDEIIMIVVTQISNIRSPSWGLIGLLQTLRNLLALKDTHRSHESAYNALMSLLEVHKHSFTPGALLEIYHTLSRIPASVILSHFDSGDPLSASASHLSPFGFIRPLLASYDPNSQYAFLACLLHLHKELWTGSSAINSMTAELTVTEEEVIRIMSFLDSEDATLRSMTYRILQLVEPAILSDYFARLLGDLPVYNASDLSRFMRPVMRLFEVLEALNAPGQLYVRGVKQILRKVDTATHSKSQSNGGSSTSGSRNGEERTSSPAVLERAVELVLLHLNNASPEDQATFIDEFFAQSDLNVNLVDHKQSDLSNLIHGETLGYGPTGVTIMAAIAAEYGSLSRMPPESMLLVLNGYISSSGPAVQEALLLSMLRVSARCTEPSLTVNDSVRKLAERSRRHIKFRCQQFLDLTDNFSELKLLASSAKSSSLPDFLAAIERRQLKARSLAPIPIISSLPPSEKTQHSSATSSSKLRYDPYDPPRAAPSRRTIRSRTASPSTAESLGSASQSPISRKSQSLEENYPDDPLSRTVTAGEIALIGGNSQWLQVDAHGKSSSRKPQQQYEKPPDLITDRIDLIGLDSPFRTEPHLSLSRLEEKEKGSAVSKSPPASPAHINRQQFEAVWSSFDTRTPSVRGWSASSPGGLLESLQTFSDELAPSVVQSDPQDPFIEDDLFILISTTQDPHIIAALKLKTGDEGSCLWMLRCDDVAQRELLRGVLQ